MAGSSLDPRDPEWPAHAADRVVSAVDAIRDKTTVPLTTVARALVFGLVAGVLGVGVVVLLAIGAVRAVDAYLPGEVWAAHLLIGLLFTVVGLYLWSKRQRKD